MLDAWLGYMTKDAAYPAAHVREHRQDAHAGA
jgi:hypothetical protein